MFLTSRIFSDVQYEEFKALQKRRFPLKKRSMWCWAKIRSADAYHFGYSGANP
jgi:hypothetical protein